MALFYRLLFLISSFSVHNVLPCPRVRTDLKDEPPPPPPCPILEGGLYPNPHIVTGIEKMMKDEIFRLSNGSLVHPPTCQLDLSDGSTKIILRSIVYFIFTVARQMAPGLFHNSQTKPIPIISILKETSLKQSANQLITLLKREMLYSNNAATGGKYAWKFDSFAASPELKNDDADLSDRFSKMINRASSRYRQSASTVQEYALIALLFSGRILHSVATSLPRKTGAENCLEKTVGYVETVYKKEIPKDVTAILKNYYNTLDSLADATKVGCNEKCSVTKVEDLETCVPKCNSAYLKNVETLYRQVKTDRSKASTTDFWSIPMRQQFCSMLFVLGAQTVSLSNKSDRLEIDYQTVVGDTVACVTEIQAAIDTSIQSLKPIEVKYAPLFRAVICRDLNPFFLAFSPYTRYIVNCSGEVKRLIAGDYIILRDTFRLTASEQWMNCGSKVVCSWDNCAGSGAKLSGYKWKTCANNKLVMFKKDSYLDPLKAGDRVEVFDAHDNKITYSYVYDQYTPSEKSECKATYFRFGKYGRTEPGRSRFLIVAYDWSGRRRRIDEEIQDRDWLLLDFDEKPNAHLVDSELGINFLEGLLHIVPRSDEDF